MREALTNRDEQLPEPMPLEARLVTNALDALDKTRSCTDDTDLRSQAMANLIRTADIFQRLENAAQGEPWTGWYAALRTWAVSLADLVDRIDRVDGQEAGSRAPESVEPSLVDIAYDIADELVRADNRGLLAVSGDIMPLRELLDAWREATGQPWAGRS